MYFNNQFYQYLFSSLISIAFCAAIVLNMRAHAAPAQTVQTSPIGQDTLSPLGGISQIATGDFHTCALKSSGGVMCWGYNGHGQLGDGTSSDRGMPEDVANLTGITAIAAGSSHSCALTNEAVVKCWGRNNYGQLGNNSTDDSNSPVDVSGLGSDVVAIAAGGSQTCILSSSGNIKCWGDNRQGQLGDRTTTARYTPVDVSLARDVTKIAVGFAHVCGLKTGGDVICWGYNGSGQLGDGTNTASTFPVNVNGLAGNVTAISAGRFHTCALTNNDGTKCWGNNRSGQLGNGETVSQSVPVPVNGLTDSDITDISAGGSQTCALTIGGGAKCWGNNNQGQLGDGTTLGHAVPVDVGLLTSSAVKISVAVSHTCALMSNGGVKCWGYNGSGRLGNGTAVLAGL